MSHSSTWQLPLAMLLVSCHPPIRNTPIQDIPGLTSLKEVMDNQSTTADPQFKRIGATNYSEADFSGFADASARIQATSVKIKDFSKGPGFDALAMALHDNAVELGRAASLRDAKSASEALRHMKDTCRQCHSQFR